MMPRQVGMGMAGFSPTGNLPLNFLQKAGVYVQRIVTTTGIKLFFNAEITGIGTSAPSMNVTFPLTSKV